MYKSMASSAISYYSIDLRPTMSVSSVYRSKAARCKCDGVPAEMSQTFTAKTMEWSSLHLGVTITPKPFTPGEWLTMEWSSLHFGVTITPQPFTPREWLHYGVTIIPFGGVTWFEVVKLMIGKWLKHAVNNYIQQMLLTVADWTLKGDSIKCERWSNILYSIWKFTFQLQSNSMLWAELCGERCYQLWWYSDTTSSSSWPSLQQSDAGVVLYMKLTTTMMLAGI